MFIFVEAPLFTKLVGEHLHELGVIWMLTIYAKNVTENIPVHLLRRIRKEIKDE